MIRAVFPVRVAISFCAVFLVLAGASPTAVAAADQAAASKALQHSLGISAGAQEPASEEPAAAQPKLGPELDSFFVKIKDGFDKTAKSALLASPKVSSVNGMFMKALKDHRLWYSLIRTDKKGRVINEVIRIEGVSMEKRSVADQSWFTRMAAGPKGHANLIKEDNGRYYLFWAEPIVATVKGKIVFAGAVAVKIDFWDCFDQFADKLMTPFSVRVERRLTLYDHLWSDSIQYVEDLFTVPGVDRIVVRYAVPAAGAVAAPAAPAVDSGAILQARSDSIRAKAAADSAKAMDDRKLTLRNRIILGGVGVLGIVMLFLIAHLVTMLRNYMLMRKINKED